MTSKTRQPDALHCPWVTIETPEPTFATQWRVVSFLYEPGAGNTLFVQCVDDKQKPQAGEYLYVIYPNLSAPDTAGDSPYVRKTDANGKADFPIFSIQRGNLPGPYHATIRISHKDSIAQYKDGWSEIVSGIGNHENRHDKYTVVFQRQNANTVPPTEPHLSLEETVLQVESTYPRMPINTDAALYKYAQLHGLGYPQGDEHPLQWNGGAYVFQTFNGGIVYAPLANVNAVQVILK